jgi:hypothetical protein
VNNNATLIRRQRYDEERDCSHPQQQRRDENDSINLERAALRLDGFEVYVLVSVITSTSSYGFIVESGQQHANSVLDVAVLSISTISTLLGMYSALIFSLSVLYGKTALGMNQDDKYFDFLDATSDQRVRAFQAFCASLLTFCLQVVLVVTREIPQSSLQLIATLVGVAAIAWGYQEVKRVFDAATPIFASKKKKDT